jgi:hypothetical protein
MIPGLLDQNKKTAITSIIESAKPKEVGESEKDSNPGLEAAVDEMFSAFEAKDKAAFKEALKSFILMCDESTDGTQAEDLESPEAE